MNKINQVTQINLEFKLEYKVYLVFTGGRKQLKYNSSYIRPSWKEGYLPVDLKTFQPD